MDKMVVRAAFLVSGILLLSAALAAVIVPCRETIIPVASIGIICSFSMGCALVYLAGARINTGGGDGK